MTVNGQAPVAYSYDAASRLRTITQSSLLSPVTLDYDASGRRTLLRLPNGVSTAYDYDLASRLTRLTYTSPSSLLGDLQYTYDAAGNRTAVSGTFARTLLPDPVASASYDAANQQLTFGNKSMAYDNNGNLASLTDPTGATTFTWDARNRLAALNAPTLTGNFAYDVQGRRVRRDLSGELREYQYDGVDIIRETVNGAEVGYLRGLGVDEPFCRIEPGGTTYYLADALSSTVALTDAGGAIGTTYSYEPFGRTAIAGLASRNPFQFTGRENDGAGLYYYRARYYQPTLMRFASQDPSGLQEGVNLYAYVDENPMSFTDPRGLWKTAPGVPLPKKRQVVKLLDCLEPCLGEEVHVTSTHEPAWMRKPGDAHIRGDAVDIRYPKDPTRALCCAAKCRAATARDEVKNPVPHQTGANIHISIVPGLPTNPGGPRGDLPPNTCSCQ